MSTEVQKYADKHMFTAEKSDAAAGPVAYLLGAPADPLGQIAACAFMYTGRIVRDLADVTDEERADVLVQIQKTVLKMPLEAVSFHFMLEGVHRGITHQMVRQRTAAYAQESTRFAVKEDLETATALPPSLFDTMGTEAFLRYEWTRERELGLDVDLNDVEWRMRTINKATPHQQQRFAWDDAVRDIANTYKRLIDQGMPAEEARGLMPTNITTRLNYITNLRSFYDTMAVRVSDQAQFEWRMVARAYALAMRDYGADHTYKVWVDNLTVEDDQRAVDLEPANFEYEERNHDGTTQYLVERSSAWQYAALTEQIRPIEFVTGRPSFAASFDRPSRIGERVAAFAECGIPSSDWLEGNYSKNIPAISPAEWLLDPDAARLKPDQEFDVFGNRVARGTGVHWRHGMLWYPDGTPTTLGEIQKAGVR